MDLITNLGHEFIAARIRHESREHELVEFREIAQSTDLFGVGGRRRTIGDVIVFVSLE
jgi:hypothetical protein